MKEALEGHPTKGKKGSKALDAGRKGKKENSQAGMKGGGAFN